MNRSKYFLIVLFISSVLLSFAQSDAASTNSPPDLLPVGPFKTHENRLLQFQLTATDPDSQDTLRITARNLPRGATFVDGGNRTGTFSWTPNFDQAGIYKNIRFTVTDGALADTEYVSIKVVNVNRPPVLDPIGNKTINEEERLTFQVHATDPDSRDIVILSVLNLPPGATFVDQGGGVGLFDWTPSRGLAGIYPNVVFKAASIRSRLSNFWVDIETSTLTVNPFKITPPKSAAEALDLVIQNMNRISDLSAEILISTALNGNDFADSLHSKFYYLPPDKSRMEYFSEPELANLEDIYISNGLRLARVNPNTMIADSTDLAGFAGIGTSAAFGMDYLHNLSGFISEHSLTLTNVNESTHTCDVESIPTGEVSVVYDKLILTIDYQKGIVLKEKLMRRGSVYELVQILEQVNIAGINIPVLERKTWYMAEGSLVTEERFSNVQINTGLSPSLFDV